MFWVALLHLLIAAGGLAVAVGAGCGQRLVVLAGRTTDQNGWPVVFRASVQRQPMVATPDGLVSPRFPMGAARSEGRGSRELVEIQAGVLI